MSDTQWEQVGAVEVLKFRLYPLDPNGNDKDPLRTWVGVDPGVYPLYRKADAYQWILTGRIDEQSEKIGDGLFVLHGGTNAVGLEVTFPSATYGPE
jgi:hypothetical protein